MSARHSTIVVAILICQAILVAVFVSLPRYGAKSIEVALALGAIILPLAGYIAAGADAPFLDRFQEALRPAMLTISSILLTFAGFGAFLCAGWLLFG